MVSMGMHVAANVKRGPYATLTLHGEVIPSHPGQFYMLRGEWGLSPLLGRPISILGEDPARSEIRFLIKAVGEGSRLLHALKPGETVQAIGPLGNHFPLSGWDPQSPVVLVGGGVGVPPMVYLARRLSENGAGVIFCQGARSKEDILLLDELEEIGVTPHISTDDGSMGHKGLVTELLSRELEYQPGAVFACGPEAMLRAVAKLCRGNVPCYVSLEAAMGCGYGVCLSCVTRVKEAEKVANQRVCKEGPVFDAEALPWL